MVSGNYATVEILIQRGVKVDKQLNTFYNKMTALMLAAGRGDLEMVKLLIEKGLAKIERPDRHKKTALTHAVSTKLLCYGHQLLDSKILFNVILSLALNSCSLTSYCYPEWGILLIQEQHLSRS